MPGGLSRTAAHAIFRPCRAPPRIATRIKTSCRARALRAGSRASRCRRRPKRRRGRRTCAPGGGAGLCRGAADRVRSRRPRGCSPHWRARLRHDDLPRRGLAPGPKYGVPRVDDAWRGRGGRAPAGSKTDAAGAAPAGTFAPARLRYDARARRRALALSRCAAGQAVRALGEGARDAAVPADARRAPARLRQRGRVHAAPAAASGEVGRRPPLRAYLPVRAQGRSADRHRRARRRRERARAQPGAARRHRLGQDLHHGAGDRRHPAAGVDPRAQQDARRAALRRVQGLLPRQRGRVLRLLLRLLPARGLRAAHGHLHREGVLRSTSRSTACATRRRARSWSATT